MKLQVVVSEDESEELKTRAQSRGVSLSSLIRSLIGLPEREETRGGPRANAGGYRPGAGRKKRTPLSVARKATRSKR